MVGERLHKVLGQIGSQLWFPCQPKALIDLLQETYYGHDSTFIFNRFFFNLADNQDRYKISDKFDFEPDRTTRFGVTRLWVPNIFPIDL